MERRIKSKDLRELIGRIRPFEDAGHLGNPEGGWLRAVRTSMGLSLKEVAGTLGVTPQAVHQLEKSEAEGRASLKQIDAAAAAMGCRLVHAVVPLQETLTEWVHAAGGPPSGDTQG